MSPSPGFSEGPGPSRGRRPIDASNYSCILFIFNYGKSVKVTWDIFVNTSDDPAPQNACPTHSFWTRTCFPPFRPALARSLGFLLPCSLSLSLFILHFPSLRASSSGGADLSRGGTEGRVVRQRRKEWRRLCCCSPRRWQWCSHWRRWRALGGWRAGLSPLQGTFPLELRF